MLRGHIKLSLRGTRMQLLLTAANTYAIFGHVSKHIANRMDGGEESTGESQNLSSCGFVI